MNREAAKYAMSKSDEIEKLIESKDPMHIVFIKGLAFSKAYDEYITSNNLDYELIEFDKTIKDYKNE